MQNVVKAPTLSKQYLALKHELIDYNKLPNEEESASK